MATAKITIKSVEALASKGGKDTYLWDDKIPGFGVKAMPSGGKSYLLKYRPGRGRAFSPRRYHIGRVGDMTPEQAREKAEDLRELIRKGIDPMAELQADAAVTVKTLITDFLQSRRNLKRRSVDETERLLNREIVQPLGERPAASITRADIAKIVDGIADRGAGILANRVLVHLHTMFKWAVGRGKLRTNPISGMEKPAAEVSRDRCPSDAELAEIWQAAEKLNWPFGRALQLLILTGLRREEISGLHWSEMKLDKAEWVLPAKRSKNAQQHIVPLSAKAVELLRALPRIVGPDGKKQSDLVFTTNGETSIQGWSKAKLAIDAEILAKRQKAAEDAGSDPAEVKGPEPWRMHDLRRSFATGLANMGVAPHVADLLLHHVSIRKGGVAAVYNKARYLTERRAAVELWASHIDAITAEQKGKVAPGTKAEA